MDNYLRFAHGSSVHRGPPPPPTQLGGFAFPPPGGGSGASCGVALQSPGGAGSPLAAALSPFGGLHRAMAAAAAGAPFPPPAPTPPPPSQHPAGPCINLPAVLPPSQLMTSPFAQSPMSALTLAERLAGIFYFCGYFVFFLCVYLSLFHFTAFIAIHCSLLTNKA